MDGDVKTFRAAQYVRMSTEHQQYSTSNQGDKIKEYADKRGIEIVRTYADDGKSGLSIGGRASLQKLIADVESGAADYTLILVYDVSRWGRFQDADEAAFYEYKLKRKGIHVVYVAEQFENDGSPVSTIVKGVKRATVAVRLDTANQAALDYYLLPRLDFGQNRISLTSQAVVRSRITTTCAGNGDHNRSNPVYS
jgi:hypothetical protein